MAVITVREDLLERLRKAAPTYLSGEEKRDRLRVEWGLTEFLDRKERDTHRAESEPLRESA